MELEAWYFWLLTRLLPLRLLWLLLLACCAMYLCLLPETHLAFLKVEFDSVTVRGLVDLEVEKLSGHLGVVEIEPVHESVELLPVWRAFWWGT